MLSYRMYINILIVATIVLISMVEGTEQDESKCSCSEDIYEELRKDIDANIAQLKKWAPLYEVVKDLKNWREDIINIIRTEMKKYASEDPPLPKPESIMMRPEDDMLNDSIRIPKSTEEDNELVKNVSNLLAKVEKVENRTMEVEEELKSERRVRRHLEQEVKETQSSLITLGDQLQNVTVPVDAVMSHVQMVIFSSIEDMNRTIYEDHLQKLYYKVDGVAYKNETRKLDERIENVETEIHEGCNASIVMKLSENVKNLEDNLHVINTSIGDDLVPRMIMLDSETVRKDTVEVLEDRMIDLLNNTEQFKREISDVWSDIRDVRNFQHKLENFSKEWAKSLEDLQTQIEVLKNKTSVTSASSHVSQTVEYPYDMDDVVLIDSIAQPKNETEDESMFSVFQNDITATTTSKLENEGDERGNIPEENEDMVAPEVTSRLRIGGTSYTHISPCDVPISNDSHLLIAIEIESDGAQKLIFGCRPIGQYIVSNSPIPVRCEDGFWNGPLPKCLPLPDAHIIEILAKELMQENPCTTDSGEFPDPTDCSRFFKCSHGKVSIMSCPTDLHFNANLKVCDYPYAALCKEDSSELIQDLQSLIPPIMIEPNNMDKPSGLLGTGPAGQLIVHPRSSFTLHCLYPENNWGYPHWNVTYSKPETVTRSLIPQIGRNKVSLTVIAATEEDTGHYRCITPFGKSHGIYVSVKAIQCPLLPIDEEYEDAFYRPTPEGETRILGTTAEFPCIKGKESAVCMADGKWSRENPECKLRKRCQPLDTSNNQDLILEETLNGKMIEFKCTGGLRLIGSVNTRCLDDGTWSQSLPRCLK